jgi:hypothetical protein
MDQRTRTRGTAMPLEIGRQQAASVGPRRAKCKPGPWSGPRGSSLLPPLIDLVVLATNVGLNGPLDRIADDLRRF